MYVLPGLARTYAVFARASSSCGEVSLNRVACMKRTSRPQVSRSATGVDAMSMPRIIEYPPPIAIDHTFSRSASPVPEDGSAILESANSAMLTFTRPPTFFQAANVPA